LSWSAVLAQQETDLVPGLLFQARKDVGIDLQRHGRR
jgi:hypothetical protein